MNLAEVAGPPLPTPRSPEQPPPPPICPHICHAYHPCQGFLVASDQAGTKQGVKTHPWSGLRGKTHPEWGAEGGWFTLKHLWTSVSGCTVEGTRPSLGRRLLAPQLQPKDRPSPGASGRNQAPQVAAVVSSRAKVFQVLGSRYSKLVPIVFW